MGTQQIKQHVDIGLVQHRVNISQALSDRRRRVREIYRQILRKVIMKAQTFEVQEENASLHSNDVSYRHKIDFFHVLPINCIAKIIECILDEYSVCLGVSTVWFAKTQESLDWLSKPIESKFALMLTGLLSFQRGYMSISPIVVSNKSGLRIDRCLVAQVNPCLANFTIKFGYSFVLNKKTLKTDYKFDVLPQQVKKIWIHKEECKFHGDEQKRAYTQPIMTICINDYIDFAVNLKNLAGSVKIQSIQWQQPIIEETVQIIQRMQLSPHQDQYKKPKKQTRATPNEAHDLKQIAEDFQRKFYLYNTTRTCELELTCLE